MDWQSRLAAEEVAVSALRSLDRRGRRLRGRSSDRMVDSGGRLVGVGRAIIVAAGKSSARGNEDGGGGKSDLGHFIYSRISLFCPSSGVPLGGFRVARTTSR